MKNACIILKKKVTTDDADASAVLNAFFMNGYSFDEIRILPQDGESQVRECITALKNEANVILFLSDKSSLRVAKRYLTEFFPVNSLQNSFGESAIYCNQNCSLLLLSADETETGVGFVKNACIPYLRRKSGVRYDTITLRAVGVSEGRMKSLLSQAKNVSGGRTYFARARKYDEDILKIIYDSNAPKMLIDDVLRLFADGLGDTLYALDDISLEEQLVNALKVRHKKISVAESFTGGGIARRITSVSGASEVYFEGLNTYNEKAKIQRLGVSEFTLKTLGAVSDQTAYEMAYGLLNTGNCDVAIATTGLAGPKTDRSGQPVGLCYLAVGVKERIRVYRYIFDGNRNEITEKAINYALFYAYRQAKDL